MSNDYKEVTRLMLECGLLKHVKRTGWWVLGIKDPESVAEHSFRCATLAYALAKMENCQDPHRAVMMALFNDVHEARVNDLHKLGQRYIDFKGAEDCAYADQVKDLPQVMSEEMKSFRKEWREQQSLESHIARDADILECLIQAREYEQQGHPEAKRFTIKAPEFLFTESAKKIWQECRTMDINQWWEQASIFER